MKMKRRFFLLKFYDTIYYVIDMENEKKRKWYSIFYLICIVLFLSSIPFSMLINNSKISYLLSLLFKIIALVYSIYYIKKDGLDKPLIEKPKIKNLILIPLIILCFSNIIFAFITNINFNENINYYVIINLVIETVFIAINEEILFRGLLFNEFKKSQNIFFAVLFQGLIFGATHLLNITSLSVIPTILVQMLYTTFLGIILGIIYQKTNNIIFPIIYHFLFNVINNILASNLFNLEWNFYFFLINILVGIITLIYTIFITWGGKKNASEHMDI